MRFFVLLIYSSVAFSLCDQSFDVPLDKFIKDVSIVVKKPFAAATDLQIKKYNCQRRVPTHLEMKKYLRSQSSLKNSLDLLINRKKGLFTKEVKTDLSLFNTESCKDEICKAQKVFGKQEGVELLYMINKFGLNGSHLVHDQTSAWTSKMLRPYLKALVAIPEFMLPIESNKQFTKSAKVDQSASKDVADSSISFYSGIDDFSDVKTTYTAFHELAHYIAGSSHFEDEGNWIGISDWTKKINFTGFENLNINFDSKISFDIRPTQGLSDSYFSSPSKSPLSLSRVSREAIDVNDGKAILQSKRSQTIIDMENTNKNEIISRYGEVNAFEDMAESIVAYRFNSKKLKVLSPKRYQYLKDKVFLGKEYLDESNCKTSKEHRKIFVKMRLE